MILPMQLRLMVEAHRGATYGRQLAIAQEAERLGFGAFFRTEHFLAMEGAGRPGPTDSWVTLGAIARETSTIRLGTIMTCATFRHPALLAIIVAQVDEMSGGRVELGIGCGWFEREHLAMGVPFPPQPERFDRYEEQLEIISGLWATPDGEMFNHDGKYYHLEDNPGLPKPVQPGGLPLVIGGWGTRRTPRLAARYAAEFNAPFSSPADARAQYGRVAAACEEIGRDPGSVAYSVALPVLCGATSQELKQRLDRLGKTKEEFDAQGVSGPPEAIIERLHEYRDAGTDRCYVQVLDLDDLDHLALLASSVQPHLADR
jgi:F420-dependent oxidoreductase-like protein